MTFAASDAATTFIETQLVDPESGVPFVLNRAERRFLDRAFTLTADGRLRHPEMLYSAPKKSGKTAFGAMIVLYVTLVLGGRFAEAYVVANDLEQAQGRVFQAIRRIIEVSPSLRGTATITANRIAFTESGSTITAIASDYAGAAGANPTITVFDELWGFTSERSHRLWDEMVPPPTRKIACRLTTTYAGFEGESALLEGLYKRGMAGEEVGPDLRASPGMLCFWTHDFVADWQTDEWREQMRAQLRPNAFLRLIENRFVTSESTFIDVSWWDSCVDANAAPRLTDKALQVWVGIDASVKRDSTAVVACAWDRRLQKVRLVFHRIFQPSQDEPLDFEATIEATVIELSRRFQLSEVRFDPYQMQSVSQRLAARGIPMVEFPQTVGNLTEASTNLFELIKAANIVVYPDAEMRLAISRSIAIETSRGWRIAKEKSSHKIDCIVALAQAALGAVQAAAKPDDLMTIWAALSQPTEEASRATLVAGGMLLDDDDGPAVVVPSVAGGRVLTRAMQYELPGPPPEVVEPAPAADEPVVALPAPMPRPAPINLVLGNGSTQWLNMGGSGGVGYDGISIARLRQK